MNTPAAPDPCAGLSPGDSSPTWCKGGSYAVDRGITPYLMSLYSDGVSLYASGSMSVVNRFSAATGAFTGWWGRVSGTPTGGDPHCTEALLDETTPGWCTGGEYSGKSSSDAPYGTTLGSVRNVNGITGFGLFIYISDGGNSRIVRVAK